MSLKQLSVFAENKIGSLYEITKLLAAAGIDIRAFSVADTENFGVLRLIVSDTRGAAFALSEGGKIVSVTDVVGVKIPDEAGGLSRLLEIVTERGVGIEYLYAFAGLENGSAYVVLRVNDNAATEKLLADGGFTLISEDMLK